MIQQTMSETEAVQFIMEGHMVGFVECDLFVPDDQISKFSILPPFCVKETVHLENLKGKQKIVAENRQSLHAGQSTVLSKMTADDIVITTDLFNWYLENGIQLKKLKKVIQFHKNLAFGVSAFFCISDFSLLIYYICFRNGLTI